MTGKEITEMLDTIQKEIKSINNHAKKVRVVFTYQIAEVEGEQHFWCHARFAHIPEQKTITNFTMDLMQWAEPTAERFTDNVQSRVCGMEAAFNFRM